MSDEPAFPVPMIPCDSAGGYTEVRCPGVSIRDYFAAAALQGLIATPKTVCKAEFVDASGYAILAYQAADAMLKAREDQL